MRILIIGGYGFLGGRISQYLSTLGYEIILGSSSLRPTPSWLKKGKTICIDRRNIESIQIACKEADVIINAAGMNSKDCSINPLEAFSINCLDVARFATIAKKVGVKLFISISTAHVYSSKLEGLISEKTCPKNHHPYASSYLAGESALLSIANDSNMKAVVLRLSNAFGTPIFSNKNCWDLVVNDLCRQSASSGSLLVKSSGVQYRDFIGINEVCRALGVLVQDDKYNSLNGIYNLGSSNSKTINQIADLIQKRVKLLFNKDLSINNLKTAHAENFNKLIYDVDKLRESGFMADEQENLNELDELIQYCHTQFSGGY